MIRVLHSFYAGLGGHTAVFFAQEKYSQKYGFKFVAGLYGVESPLDDTLLKVEDRNIPYFFVKKNGSLDLFHSLRLAYNIYKQRPDIIFLHGTYGIIFVYLLCKAFGRSKIYVRETQALNLKTVRQKINSLCSLLLSDKYIFLTKDYQAQYLSNSLYNKFRKKTTVIPNGLDLSEFFPSNRDRKSGLIRIGMCSRIVPIKDYSTLIKAVHSLILSGINNIELVIAGDGTDFCKLRQHILDLKLDEYVKLLGLVERCDLPAYFNDLDIYVHSSYGETMSNSIMQAQSSGLPIVGTNVFGVNNLIEHEKNGFLFTLGDVEELVVILKTLIADETIRQKYGGLSRKYAEHNLSDEKMCEKYFALFSQNL